MFSLRKILVLELFLLKILELDIFMLKVVLLQMHISKLLIVFEVYMPEIFILKML